MKIYVLEDDPERICKFNWWFIGHEAQYSQTCGRIQEFKPDYYDILFLDHDLGGRQLQKGSNITLPKCDLEGKVHELIYRNGYGIVEDCGLTFVKLIKGMLAPNTNVVVHSHNGPAGYQMVQEFKDQGIRANLSPFGGSDFIRVIGHIQTEQSKRILEITK